MNSRKNLTDAVSRRDAFKLGGTFLAGAALARWNMPETHVTVADPSHSVDAPAVVIDAYNQGAREMSAKQSDRKSVMVFNATREFVAENRYLNIPMKYDALERRVTFLLDGKPESAFSIFSMALADGKPDWWAYYDIGAFKGRKIGLRVNTLPADSSALQSLQQSSEIMDAAGAYRNPLRPQLCFSPLRGGCGDANGLLYYDGEYHVFFQHNPFGSGGADNSHWGHAVSTDLVHWKQLPDALHPDNLGIEYSGSGVVDVNDTSGFQTGSEKPIVLIYASAGNPISQCIAYSTDRGRIWTKYDHNPVLPFMEDGNRDPKVIWYTPQRKWIMVVAFGHCSRHNGGRPDTNPNYGLFSSKDLKHWEAMSTVYIPDTEDCPEFFEIAVHGTPATKKWIIYSGDAFYLIGSFNGRTFTPEYGPYKLNQGNNFYASQTFNNIPESDGRRILMAAASGGGGEGAGFWDGIGLPVELTLRTTNEGLRLYAYPVKELEKLRVKAHEIVPQPIHPRANPLAGIHGELLEVAADLLVGHSLITLSIRGIPVVYDTTKQELTCGNGTVPLKPVDGRIRLRAYVDRTSITLFANDGSVYMPMGGSPSKENLSLGLSAQGDGVEIISLEVYELKSIWE